MGSTRMNVAPTISAIIIGMRFDVRAQSWILKKRLKRQRHTQGDEPATIMNATALKNFMRILRDV